jgi:hypothetical protein
MRKKHTEIKNDMEKETYMMQISKDTRRGKRVTKNHAKNEIQRVENEIMRER